MNVVFVIAAAVLIAYVIFRPLDFFSVGAVCLVIYNYHCATGELYISSKVAGVGHLYDGQVLPQVYFVVLTQIILLLAMMIRYDHTCTVQLRSGGDRDFYSGKDLQFLFTVLGFISMALIVSNIIKIGVQNLSAPKSEVWSKTNGLYAVGIWMALAVFTYCIRKKQFRLLLLSLPQILITLYIGSRAFFAVLCIVLLLHLSNIGKFNLKRNLRVYLLGAVMLLVIMVYKKIFLAVKAGDFAQIIETLTDPDTYNWVMKWGEPNIVLSNFNYIVEKGIHLTAGDIGIRLAGIIPSLNDFLDIEGTQLMSDILRTEMQATYGLASNIWGEFYAAGGFPCIFIMYYIWLKLLSLGNQLLHDDDWKSYFLMPLFAYYGYYIHRMDFAKVIGHGKMVILSMLFFFMLGAILKRRKFMRLGSGIRIRYKWKTAVGMRTVKRKRKTEAVFGADRN